MNTNIGMAGEFRCVIKKADGSIKTDTGYQKNLILDQGLDFFGGGNGTNMMDYCVIGSGNSKPLASQNKLESTTIYGVRGSDFSDKTDYDASRDGNLYKTNKVRKYTFSGLSNVNISEVGLASGYSSESSYYLCTRALIKDAQGVPTTITVLSGEVLEIYYKLWKVYDLTDKIGTVNLLDGVGGSTPYNFIVRNAQIGNSTYYKKLTSHFSLVGGYGVVAFYTGDIGDKLNRPNSTTINGTSTELAYTKGTYRKVINLSLNLSDSIDFKSVLFGSSEYNFGLYQMSLKDSDGNGINKTNTHQLTLPIEISWGRYEGVL